MLVVRRAAALRSILNGGSQYSTKASLEIVGGRATPAGSRSGRILGAVSIPSPPARRALGNSARHFSAMSRNNSVNDTSTGWSNNPQDTPLFDGCDYEHWFIVCEPPPGEPTRDEIIDSYIKTLAKIVGSEEEARRKIYSVSTKHYYAFGCQISQELSQKLEPLPNVEWVLPDSYADIKTKSYGGEPFINGQAVPYDPKYHEEWVRNNARCNQGRSGERRNFDRSRNFERRREMRQNAYQQQDGYQQRPPSSAHQAGRDTQGPPGSTYQAGRDTQGPPRSAYQAGRETQGPPRSAYQAGRDTQGPPGYQAGRDAQGYQGPPGSAYPAGRDTQGPPGSAYPAGRGTQGPPGSTYQPGRYSQGPPNSTYQAGRDAQGPPSSTYQAGRDTQGPPSSTYQAGRDTQGPPSATYEAATHSQDQGN